MHRIGIKTAASASSKQRAIACFVLCALCLLLCTTFSGCLAPSTDSSGSSSSKANGTTSGPTFTRKPLNASEFDAAAAQGNGQALIDVSHTAQGYVAASATSPSKLKLQVISGDASSYYDLPSDGTPISCPLVWGNGAYSFTIWENTTGNRYAELYGTGNVDVALADEFQPFIRPSVYCSFDENSASTKLANELCADAQNEGDALCSIYTWIVGNISYDEGKAASLADATGYLPHPDDTIASKSGICFDYASLAAAMLRSQGIPCKIITGYVSPDNVYHAWNMVYLNGNWVSARIDIKEKSWSRIDTTFAAGNGSVYAGDGATYTDRYTY